jgi:hydrogenase maturation protease
MWLVIGYGSSLHGDDGLGPAVADALGSRVAADKVRVLTAVQLTLDLAEPVSAAEAVVVIDAARDVQPGQLRAARIAAPEASVDADAFTHHCSPATLLACSTAVYGHAPPMWLYTLGGVNYDLGSELSPEAATLIPVVVQELLTFINA